MAELAYTLARHRDDYINMKWRNRPREWDGWIGDEEHQQRTSDHNENKRHKVDATDTDSRQPGTPYTPIHVPSVIASMLIHPSTHYVIHNRRIMDRDDKFMPHRYTGSNPHDKHIHRSILQTVKSENATTGYKFILEAMKWPLLKLNAKGTPVRELQAYLIGHGYAVAMDSGFGAKTLAAVKAFQKAHGLKADGEVGPLTRAKLRPFK